MKSIAQIFQISSQRWYWIKSFDIFAGFPDVSLSLNREDAAEFDDDEIKKISFHYGKNVLFEKIKK